VPSNPLHTPADVVRTLLINFGIGSDPAAVPLGDWPAYKASEPNTPDDVITVYDDTDSDDGRSLRDGTLYGMNGIQFRVRSADDSTGYLKMREIQDTLSTVALDEGVVMTGANYLVHSFDRWGRIARHGKELPSSKRHVFTLTCITLIKRTG